MEKPATVVIADQSVQLCRELRTALEETGVFEVVAITNEGGKAIELVNRFSPDIFIIDLMIPLVECMPDLREIIPQKNRPLGGFFSVYFLSAGPRNPASAPWSAVLSSPPQSAFVPPARDR